MRTLVLMRGIAGCGKSTFIKNNGLENYTLSADNIRMLYSSPSLNIEGEYGINQTNDNRVWKTLFNILEERMKKGEFTVIDATHSASKSINQYRKLAKEYKYRVWVVDMSDIPLEEVKKRNKQRENYEHVPEYVLKHMSNNLDGGIPSWVSVTSPETFRDDLSITPLDYSNYRKINHIGDIHGCNKVLQEYIGEMKDDEFYIFLGDYVDRGIENAEVLEFLIRIKDKKNVLLLEGNHDRYLDLWANDKEAVSRQFKNHTSIELDSAGVSKKEVRKLYRKLSQLCYYRYNEKTILVTHGGLSIVPENLNFISTRDLIRGVGGYNDDIDNAFNTNAKENQYQVHGHRNIERLPIKNGASFNLEGKVELGGALRVLELDKDGFTEIEIDNDVYNTNYDYMNKDITIETSEIEFLDILRKNKDIREKKQKDNISSFNFTNKVFYDASWDNINTKARGLFINTHTGKIVNRGFDKFFNINEREETSIERIKDLAYPLTMYHKYNGFLGLLGYNAEDNELVFSSKSLTSGAYADVFKDIFNRIVDKATKEDIKKYLREENTSMVFEVIEPDFDPHIIEYYKPNMVLLDIIDRSTIFQKKEHNELIKVAKGFNINHKAAESIIDSYEDFLDWYEFKMQDIHNATEGWVVEDSEGFMFKIKAPYYIFWKKMRNIKERVRKGRKVKAAEFNEDELRFYDWMIENNDEFLERDIIKVRNKYEEELREEVFGFSYFVEHIERR